MKKYRKKLPLTSPSITAIAALCAAIATVMIIIFSGVDNEWCVVCGAIFCVLFFFYLFDILATSGRYRYSDKCIEVLFRSLRYKKLDYSWFSVIVISNAAYNNGYGYIPSSAALLMQYKVKGNNGNIKVTFPFITLHTSDYRIDKIRKGMSSRDLFMLNSDEMYCLGICWFDSFQELLKHTDCDVCILEDVYLRFKEQFDIILKKNNESLDRFYIVTDRTISYREYHGTPSVGGLMHP